MKMKKEMNSLKKKAVELTEEGLEQVTGGSDPIGQFDLNKLTGGEPSTDTSIEFELLLDKATYPGTDYTVIRGNREDPLY